LEKRGSSYRVWLCVDGTRHRFTVSTTGRKIAEQFATQKFAELERARERHILGLPTSLRMSELLDLYIKEELPLLAPKTQAAYLDSIKPIRRYFCDYAGDPLVDRVRNPVILDEKQYEALINACARRAMLSLYVVVQGESGARCQSEVLHIRWSDVDFEGGFLQIASGRGGHRTKSGKSRWVPMTPRLQAAFREHFKRFRFAIYDGIQSEYVFHHRITRGRQRAGERIQSMRSSFAKAVARAKLPKELHQHDLRHRRVTVWLAEEKNPVHVMEAMGHSDLRTTMGYTHLSRQHLKALVEPTRSSRSGRRIS